jgi:hypothetical protein
MNEITKLLFFLHSQLVFLTGVTLSFLFVENISTNYYMLFVVFSFIAIYPLLYFQIILRNTNPEIYKITNYQIEDISFKNRILTIIGFVALILGGISFLLKESIDFATIVQFEGFQYVYITYALLILLVAYFFIQSKNKEYAVFENFILINILKYKIIKLAGRKSIHILTRKLVKKDEVIQGIKHLFGGVYYY